MDPGQLAGDDDGQEIVLLSDDILTSVPNATQVLEDGPDLHRIAVLYQFPQFLEHCPGETLNTMVPRICKFAPSWPENALFAGAEALFFLVDVKLPLELANDIVSVALVVVKQSTGRVFDVWGEILAIMVPQVSKQHVLDQIIPAIRACASAEHAESRMLAARVMGALAESLTGDELVSHGHVEAILRLCQDSESSVRAMAVQSLADLGSKFPVTVMEAQVWPQLQKMLSDSSGRVQAMSIKTFAITAEAHKGERNEIKTYSDTLIPLFIQECKKATELALKDLRTVDDDTFLMLEMFAEAFAHFLVALGPMLIDTERWLTAMNTVRRLITCNGPTVRHWCAFNLPAVSLVCLELRKPDRLKGVLPALASDSDIDTRVTLAGGIHEVTRNLRTTQLRPELCQTIITLLADQIPLVRAKVLENFALILELLVENETEKYGAARELAGVFQQLNLLAQESWRAQMLLAEQLGASAQNVPTDFHVEFVAPILFQMARESTYLVRKASMVAMAKSLRYVSDVRRRDHIVKHFFSEWANGKVYWTRLAFLDGCNSAYETFSHTLFAEIFAAQVFRLADDPVPNVRLGLITSLTNMLPGIFSHPGLKPTIDKLCNDSDIQVREESEKLRNALRTPPVLSAEETAKQEKMVADEKAFFLVKKKKTKAGASGAGVTPSSAASVGVSQQPAAQAAAGSAAQSGAAANKPTSPTVTSPSPKGARTSNAASQDGKKAGNPNIRPPQFQPATKQPSGQATVRPPQGRLDAEPNPRPASQTNSKPPDDSGGKKPGCCVIS
ncbi:Serine/threonine-protein phosphatase 4 regulatory subunit 4 [Porphyridium purpureum]|uniref:Serine/threonine-protein phosphatase 4 regulatory subunit 4 n=1 Tax=Porphyridium purpureum TaxID=35688 RepID=A0A5J4Z9P2_PORPP|nr:Serine/threonine-protein phosphatase 4 regulatory subunit 4 [Porphyridium purpureum]|eukprot:POR6903..scf295_1